MRVATVDGLVTLFYDGSKELYNRALYMEWLIECYRTNPNFRYGHDERYDVDAMDVSEECKRYIRERQAWQQIIVVDGVTEIPRSTFVECSNIEKVIFADSVTRIEKYAFTNCRCLSYIKWSLNLEYIVKGAFEDCNLSSVFIPPRCREIGERAFRCNKNLEILNVPQNTELNQDIFESTKLSQSCPFPDHINAWLKNINNNGQSALHRVCCSFEPTLERILDVMKEKGGPKAFKLKNSIGITPSRYLEENPYAHVKEKEVMENYILQMMGEL